MAMWKCEMGHLWKKSDGDICPDCPKLTCDVCSYVWYTRQSNMCPNCPKWVCSDCKHRWYKRDGDSCPKCLPKWTCAECNHQWYKKDDDECPKCPINVSLNEFKEKFNEITEENDAIQYFDSELPANISRLFTDGIKERKQKKKDEQIDEKDEKDEMAYDVHLKLGSICHSVEEYITCLDHVRKALKIQPDFNEAMTTFEEYGYVQYKQSKDGKSGYFENEIDEIIKNGTNNIKIFAADDEKEEEQKYDDKFFKTNLPYHHYHNFKQKKFEESKINKNRTWSSYGDSYNERYKMELDFARRVCGESDLERYINTFVHFRIVDEKQINETILRAIMDINDDEHIEKIFKRLQNVNVPEKKVPPDVPEKKVDDIAEEMKKYNDNIYKIHNRSHQVKQLINILQDEVSKITGRGKELKNEQAINEFIGEMKNDNNKIEQLLISMKDNKYFEKLSGLRSFIEFIKDIKSITLIDEDSDLYKLLKKSWDKICNVYSQPYLYHIEHETKKDLKCVLQSFGFLHYVTEKKILQYAEGLKKAKDCGFDKETKQYFELIEKQTKLRNEIKRKQSSFLSMADKFASILRNQYHRDRLSMENEMKNVQSNTIQSKLTLWSVQHEKRKQQQENVKNHMKKRIEIWNKYIQPNITTKMNEMIKQQRVKNDEFLKNSERQIGAILSGDNDNKLKEKFLDIFFVSSLMENTKS